MNIVDVRDIAQAHRLCIESTVAGNGSRYIIAAADESGILYTPQLQEKMKELFPQFENIGGEARVVKVFSRRSELLFSGAKDA